MNVFRFAIFRWAVVVAVAAALGGSLPSFAYVPPLTFSDVPSTLYGHQRLTLQGTVNSACANHTVALARRDGTTWTSLGKTETDAGNTWRLITRVPNSARLIQYRADCGAKYAATVLRTVMKTNPISFSGPGNRILGLDISRWQHIPGQVIDFAQMASAGVSFVIIKASDGFGPEDAIAQQHVIEDASRAKAAGMYVGYYHMISIPTGNSTPVLIASANRQATLIATRLKQLGGYDVRTLPYTLDIEGINSSITQASLELWTKTIVTQVTQLTKRTPIIYSYRSLLASHYSRSDETVSLLRGSHLWLAQPGNPADPAVQVGEFRRNPFSCFHTAWATASCRTVWTIWQYTSSGNRDKFGIPWAPLSGNKCPSQAHYCIPGTGTGPLHLDLDVFNGDANDLERLADGSWTRTPADYIDPSPTPSPSATSSVAPTVMPSATINP